MKRLLRYLLVLSLSGAIGVWLWITSPRFRYNDPPPQTPPAQQASMLLRNYLPLVPQDNVLFQHAERHKEQIIVHGITLRLPPPIGFSITIDRLRFPAQARPFNGRFIVRGLRVPVRKLPLGIAFVLMQAGYLKDLIFDLEATQAHDHTQRRYQLSLRAELRDDARLSASVILDDIDTDALHAALRGNPGMLLQARLVSARLTFTDIHLIDNLLRLAVGQNRAGLARRIDEHLVLLDDPTARRVWRAIRALLAQHQPLTMRLRPPVPVRLQQLLVTGQRAWERLPGLDAGPAGVTRHSPLKSAPQDSAGPRKPGSDTTDTRQSP